MRGIGGKRDEEAALREEFGGEDAGQAEEKYLGDVGYGAAGGLAAGDAADVAEADLEETEPPRSSS
jgi:hypothetical protein